MSPLCQFINIDKVEIHGRFLLINTYIDRRGMGGLLHFYTFYVMIQHDFLPIVLLGSRFSRSPILTKLKLMVGKSSVSAHSDSCVSLLNGRLQGRLADVVDLNSKISVLLI